MNVNIVLITHEDIGQTMLKVAEKTYGELPTPVTAINIDYRANLDVINEKITQFIEQIHQEQEVLMLTDLFGATPCNIALRVKQCERLRIISGLNLPMLLKTLNYTQLPLNELAQKAIAGGKAGIIDCINCNKSN